MGLKLPEGAVLLEDLELPEGAVLLDEKPKRSTGEELVRQTGLAGRYLTEGGLSLLDLAASGVREGLNYGLKTAGTDYRIPQMSIGEKISDIIGLPKPETKQERIVGEGTKFLSSVLTPGGVSKYLNPKSEIGQGIKNLFTDSIGKQGIAATGAGVASQTAEEMGADPLTQTGVGFAAALVSPKAFEKTTKPVTSLYTKLNNAITKSPNPNQAIDNVLDNVLSNNNIKFTDLSDDVVSTIKNDITEALKINKNLSDDALKRLVDYRITGATPKQGTLTLNPALITKEKNLSKLGANSQDPKAQQLANIENQNNQILLQNLDDLGANKSLEPQIFGQQLFTKFKDYADNQQSVISGLYNQVKTSNGLFAKFDEKSFLTKTNQDLKQELVDKFLPSEVRGFLKDIQTKKMDFDVATVSQLKSIISRSLRNPTLDGNIKKSLSVVRNNLENVNLQNNQGIGQSALNAEKAARKYTFNYKKLEDSIPALKALNKGNVNPDTFFDKYIIRTSADDLEKTLSVLDPSFKQLIKENVMGYIKNKATNGRPNELAQVSGNALQKVLSSLGTKKLNLLFTKEEIAKLKSISNVASYEQFIPRGAAVNTSNTTSALYNLLERIGTSAFVGKVPLGRAIIGEPAQNVVLGKQATEALNAPMGITGNVPSNTRIRNLLSPYSTGLLNLQDQQ